MNKQILSVAIAVPIVLVSAGQSLAGDGVKISEIKGSIAGVKVAPATTGTSQPAQSIQLLPGASLENSIRISGEERSRPGSGPASPVPGKGPKPPRIPDPEAILQIQNRVVSPGLDSSLQNPTINGSFGR